MQYDRYSTQMAYTEKGLLKYTFKSSYYCLCFGLQKWEKEAYRDTACSCQLEEIYWKYRKKRKKKAGRVSLYFQI